MNPEAISRFFEALLGELDLSELGLVAARVAPLTVVAPWLALRRMPASLRSAVVVGLTLAFGTVAPPDAALGDASPLVYVGWLLREVIVGTLFAVAVSLPLYALDWAGRLVDTWRGASLAEIIAPNTGERTSPVGELYALLGIAIFFVLGGHRAALRAFAASFETAPLGNAIPAESAQAIALQSAELTGSALAFAFAVAAPAAAAIVLVELALGLLARSAPQVPVFFAGMPLRAAAGLAALLTSLSLVVADLPGAFRGAIEIASRWMNSL
ncbi:MAG: flagellar biosynthetic protein FliR [Myxococcota bacterium]